MIANAIRTCFPIAANVVADRAEEINKLNVFPVPDGDTGTNMSLTLNTVVAEVEALPQGASMEDIAQAITHGSLMGARGNSGVITSQILRGLAEGLCDIKGDEVGAQDIARAFKRSQEVAFQAVRKPVEGTILTVLKDVAAKADSLKRSKKSTYDILDDLVVEAYESVARTPDLLPVLKENGVVDSGAFGFATFLEAFVNALEGKMGELREFETTVTTTDADAKDRVSDLVKIELNDDWEGSEFKYCTEFLFHAANPDFDVEENIRYLSSLGDCELLVGAFPDFKVHVHTNRPDYVLRHMIHRGEVFNVFIHNMDLEAQERTESIRADKEAAQKERRPLGFVAVAAGSGQEEILRSLGVDVIVLGGQTMNPSTADILKAVEETNAEQVIVLPNNGNIRMAAEAAASACETSKVAVVPTKSVPQAFAAMFAMNTEQPIDELVQTMTEAAHAVHDGEVTTAVRDSQAADGSPIHAGDVMGIADDSIDVVGSDVKEVTLELINVMLEKFEGDTLTLLAGVDFSDEELEELVCAIEEAQPDVDVDPHRGEQPLYPVVFSIE